MGHWRTGRQESAATGAAAGSGSAEVLPGGNTSGQVVRIDGTVRKRWEPGTQTVHEYLAHLRARGIDVPAPLGRDEQGRQILEHVPGPVRVDAEWMTLDDLARVGRLLRSVHDASTGFHPSIEVEWDPVLPAHRPDLMCHNDVAPWNLVVGDRWVLIDWDAAAPSTRLWDLAYAAQTFTLNAPSRPAPEAGRRLRALVDGYDPSEPLRRGLPAAVGARAQAMYALLRDSHASGREPWASMFVSGHGEHWREVARYTTEHKESWASCLGGTS